ncbi:MAG: YncE family protein, partial [Betaproteobacteria bacterium]
MNSWLIGILAAGSIATGALAADIIVSAQDGKFVRVDGRATFPEPAPPDSLVVIDASQFP